MSKDLIEKLDKLCEELENGEVEANPVLPAQLTIGAVPLDELHAAGFTNKVVELMKPTVKSTSSSYNRKTYEGMGESHYERVDSQMLTVGCSYYDAKDKKEALKRIGLVLDTMALTDDFYGVLCPVSEISIPDWHWDGLDISKVDGDRKLLFVMPMVDTKSFWWKSTAFDEIQPLEGAIPVATIKSPWRKIKGLVKRVYFTIRGWVRKVK